MGLVIDHPKKDSKSRTVEDQVTCTRCGKVFVDVGYLVEHIRKEQCVPPSCSPPLLRQKRDGSSGSKRVVVDGLRSGGEFGTQRRVITLGDGNGIQLKDPRLADIQSENVARCTSSSWKKSGWPKTYYGEILRVADQKGLPNGGAVRRRFVDEQGRPLKFEVFDDVDGNSLVLANPRMELQLGAGSWHDRTVAVLKVAGKPYVLEPMLRLPDIARRIGLRL